MKASQTLLQMKYARVIQCFAKLADISLEEALGFFYHSLEYQLIREGVSDLHAMSDMYLAEDLLEEYKAGKSREQDGSAVQNRQNTNDSSLRQAIEDSRSLKNLYAPFTNAEEAAASMLED